jgi:uncharacterized delta-60 repeat protein
LRPYLSWAWVWLLLGFPVSALAAGGDLDTAFGGDGKVTTHFAGETDAAARAVAIQTDGKLVVAGASQVSHRRFALARYDSNGTLDPSFGADGDGKVRTRFAEGSGDAALAVAIQANGKIVAAG